MKRYILSILLCMLTWTMLPFQAGACSCAKEPTAEEAFAEQGAVFSGKVKEIRTWKQNGRKGDEAIFEVETSWKGVASKLVAVRTEWSSCHVTLQEGESYLLYAYMDQEQGVWHVNTCSRMMVLSEAGEDIQQLTALAAPKPLDQPVSLPSKTNDAWWYAGGAVAAASGVLLYVRRRKRRE